jgi:peptide/nickel transport system substrate-binding protein
MNLRISVRLFTTVCLLAAAALAQGGGELRFSLRSEPKALHPLLAADDSSETVRYLTGGALVRLNRRTQRLEPELALRWKTSPDGRAIRFWLRSGVRFSDGTPFSAADVRHTFEMLMQPKLNSPVADALRPASGTINVAVEAPDRVNISFPAPVAELERQFDNLVMLSAASPLKERAGLGPFQLAEHKPGSYLLLRRNPHYWKRGPQGQQLPYLDAVRLEIQSNRELELMRFSRGELDMIAPVDPENFDRLTASAAGRALDLGPGFDVEILWLNQARLAPLAGHKKAWFASAAFRRAVSEAINRPDLARLVFRGHATPAAGPVSPADQFWFNERLKPHASDPAAALRRLAAGGFRKTGDSLVDLGGNKVEFSLITNAGNKTRERMAAMIQEDLRKIGIRLNVVTLDFPSLLARVTRSFDYEACLLGWVNVAPDPNSHMNILLSSAAQHAWNPAQAAPETPWEAEIDRLMRAQAATTEARRRKAHFDRVQQILSEQAPMLYLVNKNVLVAYSARLANVQPAVLRPQLYWNAELLQLSGMLAERR